MNRHSFRLALAALAVAGLCASFAVAGRTDDPRPGSRRALAVAELVQACDWMHTSTKLHGLGYSVAHVQRTHVYRALVIMGGTWPAPPVTTSTVSTLPAATAPTGTGPGTGSGTGTGNGVPPPAR